MSDRGDTTVNSVFCKSNKKNIRTFLNYMSIECKNKVLISEKLSSLCISPEINYNLKTLCIKI